MPPQEGIAFQEPVHLPFVQAEKVVDRLGLPAVKVVQQAPERFGPLRGRVVAEIDHPGKRKRAPLPGALLPVVIGAPNLLAVEVHVVQGKKIKERIVPASAAA